MNLKIEAIPRRNAAGEEVAIYADSEAIEQLVDSLEQANDHVGLAFAQIGNNFVHIFKTDQWEDEEG